MIFAIVSLALLLALLYMTWDQNQRIDDIEEVLTEMLTEEPQEESVEEE